MLADSVKFVFITFIFFLCSKVIVAQNKHHISASFTPALTGVNVNNFPEFSINSFNKELYSRQKPDISTYGFMFGFNYTFRFNPHWAVGVGYFSSKKESSSGEFFLYETSKSKTIYYHKYSSTEIPVRGEYFFHLKTFSPVFAIEVGPEFFKKFEMEVYSINNETDERNNFITETHYEVNNDLIRIGVGVNFGVSIQIFKFLSVLILPEFRYYSDAIRIEKCPDCSTFIGGNMWLLGLRTGITTSF